MRILCGLSIGMISGAILFGLGWQAATWKIGPPVRVSVRACPTPSESFDDFARLLNRKIRI